MEKRPLNQASLDVWYEIFKDTENLELSEKIIFLYASQDISEEGIKELNEMIRHEKDMLEKATIAVANNNNIAKKIYDLLNVLHDDERLQTLFSNIAISKYVDNDYIDAEDVEKSYHDLRIKDVDLQGHEELNKLYDDIMVNIKNLGMDFEHTEERVKCNVENCVYCTPISQEEKQNAYSSLEGDGFFNMDSKEALIELMVIIQRYERLSTGFFNDVDDEDDDDD